MEEEIRRREGMLSPAKLVRWYMLLGILWIAVSDVLISFIEVATPAGELAVDILSDSVYMLLTAGVLYSLLRRNQKILRNSERRIEENQKIGQALLDAIPDLVLHLSRDGRIVSSRNIHESLVVPDLEEWDGKLLWEIFPDVIARRLLDGVHETLACTQAYSPPFDFQMSANGAVKSWEVRMARCGDEGVMAIVRDMTKYRRLLDELRYMGMNDPLTGLHNRAFFDQEMQRLQGYRHVPVAVVVCDIDGLKGANDRYGHEVGDRLIQAAAEVLRQTFRAHDIIARIGGDEFAVLLPKTPPAAVENAAGRLRKLEEEYNAQGPTVPLRLSMGIAVSDEVYADMQELFRMADNRMYEDKKSHRQCPLPAGEAPPALS